MCAAQLQEVLEGPARASEIEEHLRRTYIPYARLDLLRVTLAKHEVRGERGSVASAPGHGRFNRLCGAVEYMIGRGNTINDQVNRATSPTTLEVFENTIPQPMRKSYPSKSS